MNIITASATPIPAKISCCRIGLSNYASGKLLGTRATAIPLREQAEAALETGLEVEFDFAGVAASQSFLDELVGGLILRHGSAVADKLIFKNYSADVRAILEFVAADRGDQYASAVSTPQRPSLLNIAAYREKLDNREALTHTESVMMLNELEHFQHATAYLASCQAATLDNLPKSTSKTSRARHSRNCQIAADLLDGDAYGIQYGISVASARAICLGAVADQPSRERCDVQGK